MPTYSRNLAQSLTRAVVLANEQKRQFATPEDLLIALIDDADAADVMRASNIDFERLRHDLLAYMEGAKDELEAGQPAEPRRTADLQRVLERASVHAQSVGRDVVNGAHVLVQLFGEPVGHFLQLQGMTRYHAVCFLSHGVIDDSASVAQPAGASPERQQGGSADSSRRELVLLNDDYTPMEFVVQVLKEVLGRTDEDAVKIMLDTHRQGAGCCGVYDRAQAEDLAALVIKYARTHGHPLWCVAKPC